MIYKYFALISTFPTSPPWNYLIIVSHSPLISRSPPPPLSIIPKDAFSVIVELIIVFFLMPKGSYLGPPGFVSFLMTS
jgi:hypothetical protein